MITERGVVTRTLAYRLLRPSEVVETELPVYALNKLDTMVTVGMTKGDGRIDIGDVEKGTEKIWLDLPIPNDYADYWMRRLLEQVPFSKGVNPAREALMNAYSNILRGEYSPLPIISKPLADKLNYRMVNHGSSCYGALSDGVSKEGPPALVAPDGWLESLFGCSGVLCVADKGQLGTLSLAESRCGMMMKKNAAIYAPYS